MLDHQIDLKLYERQADSSKKLVNFNLLLPPVQGELASDIMKDPYIFELTDLKERVLEKDIDAAKWWKEIKGGVIKLNPRLNMPEGIKTADLEIDGIQVEVKTLYGEGKWAIFNLFNKVKQADTYLINIANSPLSKSEIRDQIELLYKSNSRKWINMIIVRDKDELIEVYKRT